MDMTYSLEQVLEACGKATPGEDGGFLMISRADREFALMARTALPELVQQVKELEAENADKERYTIELYSRAKQAEAENAALVATLHNILDTNFCCNSSSHYFICNSNPDPMKQAMELLSEPHPGADLLAELEQHKKALELACKRISLLQCQDLSMTDEFMKRSLFKAKAGDE